MKQGKVSMVVPCYNKEKYIDDMLRSVYMQIWDNIELILVNDGSTDKTRDIISEWEPKLQARGYEVIIIDQVNAGCCAAVHAGLIRMTGDYYCLADCDDELMPEYVSRMAGFLDEHRDYEWTACTCLYRKVNSIDGELDISEIKWPQAVQNIENMLENYMLRRTIVMVWVYMARVAYVKRCKLAETFIDGRFATYEPFIAVPLMFGKGKIKFFDEPLYIYNKFASDLSRFDTYEKIRVFYDEYFELFNRLINRLEIGSTQKDRLCSIAKYGHVKELIIHVNEISDKDSYLDTLIDEMCVLINGSFSPSPDISSERVKRTGCYLLFAAADDCILGVDRDTSLFQSKNRIIAYGVFGKVAEYWLPVLNGTMAQPTDYWDAHADGSKTITGHAVTKPDFAALSADDLVIVFPKIPAVYEEVRMECRNAAVISLSEIKDILHSFIYPEFYNGCKLLTDYER